MFKQLDSRAFLFFIITTFIIRIFFTSFVGLIDDEAYHWSWTQDLMLSYYDHPGLIAWLEKLTTYFLGNTFWGVRLPSFICYSLAVYVFYRLSLELFNRGVAQVATAIFLWSPFFGFGGYVASPEAPFILFWLLAAWVFWQGVRPDGKRWSAKKTWLTLGIVMGLGLNSKFIIALLAPAFALYLFFTSHWRVLLTRWPWLGILIATILCLPIFIWNHEYGWPGFVYQFYDRHTGREFSLDRWLVWLSAQFVFYTPVIFGCMIAALIYFWKNWKMARSRFLLCMALPSLLIFYPQPLWADYKPHWPGAAHLFLLIGASHLIVSSDKWRKTLALGVLAFYIPMNLITYTPFLGPWMPALYESFGPQKPWDSKWDLSNEFYGWREVGAKLLEMQKEAHRDNGIRPFLAALRYETTAQTWWGSQQQTYMLSSVRSHYTVVQKKRELLEGLKGLPALVVTTEKYPADPQNYAKWDNCIPKEYPVNRGRYRARTFTVWSCQNFQGLIRP